MFLYSHIYGYLGCFQYRPLSINAVIHAIVLVSLGMYTFYSSVITHTHLAYTHAT